MTDTSVVNKLVYRIRHYIILTRPRISIMSALSSLAGYCIVPAGRPGGSVMVFIGVYLLASGASALNQAQECRLDAHMERTSRRPVPMKTITRRNAFIFSGILIAAGESLLYSSHLLLMPLLGICAVLVYNVLYTKLKTIISGAYLVGAIAGAIPPVIGGAYAHGCILKEHLLLALLLYIWQIPHSWIILLKYEDEYGAVGLPVIINRIKREFLQKLAAIWIVPLGCIIAYFPMTGIILKSEISMLLLMLSTGLCILTVLLFMKNNVERAFLSTTGIVLNGSITGVLLLFSLNGLYHTIP